MIGDDDLRDLFAMFKSVTGVSAEDCYKFSDEMMEARKSNSSNEAGIVAIKRKYERKVNE
jgi:hypothetical protein